MRRAEIWWAALPPPVGRRPVVLVSRDREIQVREAVTVALVTTVVRDIASEVPLGRQDGLPKDCVINCDVLQTIPKLLIKERITTLSRQKQAKLDEALRFSLAL